MQVGEYLFIPFKAGGRDRKGVDCWGLVRLIYKDRLGIDLPLYSEVDYYQDQKVQDTIESERHKWLEIQEADLIEGDVVAIRIEGYPWHLGVIVEPRKFIHADPGRGIRIERTDAIHWKNRILGYHRYTP
jgi:cell wall-associated NlpC family hydrolase